MQTQPQLKPQTENIKLIQPKVFNFRKHWSKKVKPHLFHKDVQYALDYGMNLMMELWKYENKITNEKLESMNEYMKDWYNWTPGSPPYHKTSSDYWCYHRKPLKHSVGWYQCRHCCHWICYFCIELGMKIYPKLDWYIVSGRRHSVAVGFKYGQPYMIFDILNFEDMSAENILDFADRKMTKNIYEKKWRKENRYGIKKG